MSKRFMVLLIGISMLAVMTVAHADVIWTGLRQGEVFYTRGCSKEKAWINRMKVVKVDKKGVAWGTLERAYINDPEFKSLSFPVKENDLNISKICVSGGCYTKEQEAIADVKRWLKTGCP